MKPYIRTVHYYETDQMSFVHHSNYIRWFEEARLDLLAQYGVSYAQIEAKKILIPVVDVSCKYHRPAKYADTVKIETVMTQYNGVKLCFCYTITNDSTGELLTTGTSTHCFINEDGRPLSLKRHDPELHEQFLRFSRSENF